MTYQNSRVVIPVPLFGCNVFMSDAPSYLFYTHANVNFKINIRKLIQ